jgi:hypothetical protein
MVEILVVCGGHFPSRLWQYVNGHSVLEYCYMCYNTTQQLNASCYSIFKFHLRWPVLMLVNNVTIDLFLNFYEVMLY